MKAALFVGGGELLPSYDNLATFEKLLFRPDPDELRLEYALHMLRTEIYHCTPSELDAQEYDEVIGDFLMWAVREEAKERNKQGKGNRSGQATFGG